MIGHRRIDGDPVQRRQDRAVGPQAADRVKGRGSELSSKYIRAVQGLDLGNVLGLLHRPVHQVADSPSHRTVGNRAAPVRRGDEDQPAHERHRLEDQQVGQSLTQLARCPEAFHGDGDRGIPESRTGALRHHLGEHATHAVADQDRAVERRVAVRRIDHVANSLQ